MNRLKRFLTDTAVSFSRVALRYPVETALSLYAFALSILSHERIVDNLPDAVIGIMPLTFFAALIAGTQTRKAAAPWRVVYYALLLLPALSWAMGDAWFETNQFRITVGILAPLGVLMARRAMQNRRFVGETLAYVEAGAIGGIFALVALLAFLAIFHSIVYIFGIWNAAANDVDIYAGSFTGLTLWPLLALSMLDRFLDADPRGSKTTDALLNYILTPALLVYAAILYLYCLQIGFTWTLPKGGVAYLVFGFTIALFAVKALQELVVRRRYDWFFDRISCFALPPLVLFWAGVAQRVADYGLTDQRVYLIVCGAIMTVAVGLFFAQQSARYYYIAATAFALFLTTAYIPYFSASALSLRSQTARVQRLAAETELLDASGRLDLTRIDECDTTLFERYRELYSSLDYIDDNDTLVLTGRLGINRSAEFVNAFENPEVRSYIRWGYRNGTLVDLVEASETFSDDNRREPLDIGGYRYCYNPVSYGGSSKARYSTANDTLRLWLPDGRELLRRSLPDLFTDRCDQLLYRPDDDPLYSADNLLVYRTDSLLISFSWADVSRAKQRYTDLSVDRFYTK